MDRACFYVALLRGINVGGKSLIGMPTLKASLITVVVVDRYERAGSPRYGSFALET